MLRGLLLLLRETAMLRGLLLWLRGTAAERTAAIAERTAAERTAAITREMGSRSLVAPRGGWRILRLFTSISYYFTIIDRLC